MENLIHLFLLQPAVGCIIPLCACSIHLAHAAEMC